MSTSINTTLTFQRLQKIADAHLANAEYLILNHWGEGHIELAKDNAKGLLETLNRRLNTKASVFNAELYAAFSELKQGKFSTLIGTPVDNHIRHKINGLIGDTVTETQFNMVIDVILVALEAAGIHDGRGLNDENQR